MHHVGELADGYPASSSPRALVRCLVFFLVLTASTTSGQTQPLATSATPVSAADHTTPTPLASDRRPLSPAAAVGVSVLVPVATVSLGVLVGGKASDVVAGALIVGGALVGPSAGNLLQGAYRDALVGTGLRTLGSGLVAGAFASTFMNAGLSNTETNVITGVAIVGTALVLVGTGYDINTSARNAARGPVTLGVGTGPGVPVARLHVGL